MTRLFVSYARRDMPIVQALVDDLREMGYEPFFDQELTGGQRWWDVLLDRIRDSDAFLPVLSHNYCESEACAREAEWARRSNIPFLPIDLGEIGPELCDAYVAEANWVRYRLDERTSIARLARAVGALPPHQPPSPLPERPPIPITYLAATRQEIRDSATISPERQSVIIATLRTKLGTEADSSTRTLLGDLRRRPDVTYDNAVEIDRVLKSAPRPVRRSPTDAEPRDGGRTHAISSRSKAVAAVVFSLLVVAAATGTWLATRNTSHPTVAGGAGSTAPGHHTPSMSMSMPGGSPSTRRSPSASHMSAPNSLTAMLERANASMHDHLLPPRTCQTVSATYVACDNPAPGAAKATFRTYSSLGDLYAGYTRRITALGNGQGHLNFGDCRPHHYEGETGWNHNEQHKRLPLGDFTKAKLLNPDTQAAGRVFCREIGDAMIVIWTQDDARMLAEVDGGAVGQPTYGHPSTMDWWKDFHHYVAMNME